MTEEDFEYQIKEFLPSKKARKNYKKFLEDLTKITAKEKISQYICNYCGKVTDGCYVSDKNFYCNPECATKDFEKRLKNYTFKLKFI